MRGMSLIRRPTAAAAAHAFKGFDDWIEVFRAGDHTDSKGRPCSFTASDLDQMAANVDAVGVPAVLGHPKHNDPAYGWARQFKRAGDLLLARFSDVNPQFAAGVQSGAYRNRSISVVKDPACGWKMQHIGWLGAALPAISGLRPVEFTAHADAHEFSAEELWPQAWALGDIAGVFRRLREWLISKDGQDVADRVMPDYHITSISDQAAALRAAAVAEAVEDAPAGTNPNPVNPLFNQQAGASMSFTQADLDRAATEAAAKAKAEAEATHKAQFAASQAELLRLRGERQAERIGATVKSLVSSGVVTPAQQAGLAEFMTAIDGLGEFEFSAAGTSVKKAPADWFVEFMSAKKPVVTLGRAIVHPTDAAPAVDLADARAIAAAANEFIASESKQGRVVQIETAVAHVVASNTPAA